MLEGQATPFSTDTAAALRAAEIDAEVILLQKESMEFMILTPKNPGAKKFTDLNYIEVLNKGLGVMDSTATSLCMDNKIPLIVFGINVKGNIKRVVMGDKIGTFVKGESK